MEEVEIGEDGGHKFFDVLVVFAALVREAYHQFGDVGHTQVFDVLVEMLVAKQAHVDREGLADLKKLGIFLLVDVLDEASEVAEDGAADALVEERQALVADVYLLYGFVYLGIQVARQPNLPPSAPIPRVPPPSAKRPIPPTLIVPYGLIQMLTLGLLAAAFFIRGTVAANP